MKSAFIPKKLRPSVVGSAFSFSNISSALSAVSSVKALSEISDQCLRHKLISKVIENTSDSQKEDCELPNIKLLRSIFFNHNQEGVI